MKKIMVWDLPTRAFHWLMAISFAGAYVTGDSEKWRDIHVLLGYTMLGLITFRLVWGLFGTRYARFRSFLYGPATVLGYLKSLLTTRPQHYLGHNPAGSWAIWMILLLGVLSGVSGYVAYAGVGGDVFVEVHEAAANAMLAVIGVHVTGVLVSSLLHHENLVRSMITGYKNGEPAEGIRRAHWVLGAGVVAAVLGYWMRLVG